MSELLADHRSAFDAQVDRGVEPASAGCTYEWHCTECDATNYLSSDGGILTEWACDPRCAPEHLEIHVMLAGERWSMGTAADLTAVWAN